MQNRWEKRLVTVHAPDVFRARPGGHGFSRCVSGPPIAAPPQSRSRVVESRGRFPRRLEGLLPPHQVVALLGIYLVAVDLVLDFVPIWNLELTLFALGIASRLS
jgi:hypothetical protein